ncbi:LysM peptidoglycan-binding domain-containing protein [Stappia sp.]|uniref:LysM peptidoglycan-binding domain-containing protein n=1 Tax=Stappia sp. TaxID=1870903 RepID=UPI003C7C7641
MSRKVVVQLLILAGIVGAGAFGIGLWQLQQQPGDERVATTPTDAPAATDGERTASVPDGGTPSTAPDGDTAQGGTAAIEPRDESADAPAPVDTAATTTEGSEPTFDLMRVEPDGSTVVAGRSEAGAIVALLSNGKVVGKGIANAAGEFAIVLDTPLDPGAHAVTLETRDDAGTVKSASRQSIAVSVPEDPASGEVLVMLNEPGAPSQILQKPETETTTAGATPQSGQADDTSRDVAALTETAAETAKAPAQVDTTPAAAEAPATPSSAQPAEQRAADATPEASPAPATSPSTEVAAAPATDSPAATGAPAGETGGQATDTPATPRVTVEAVETEDSKVFVAGAGEPNSDVRVYFDNTLIGEARTDSKGRWLMETENEIAPGEVDVRADQIVPDSGTVVARAQVTFERAEDAIVLRPVSATGTAGEGDGASASTGARQIPSIIIRSGDNLWTISQRRYGEGLRYTTIYQANKDQIRNPDLIYPGQVFMIPEGDRNWPVAN